MSAQPRRAKGSAGSTGGQFTTRRSNEAPVEPLSQDWVQDGVTPHPTGGYVTVTHHYSDHVMYRNAEGARHRLDGPADVRGSRYQAWYCNGRKHNLDGPAVVSDDGRVEYWVDGLRHRVDGPAIAGGPFGYQEWRYEGLRHRVDGPAIIRDGSVEYYVGGVLHRVGGPAIEYSGGYRAWYQDGRKHNLDGPAVIDADGAVEYWVEGRHVTEAEFTKIQASVIA